MSETFFFDIGDGCKEKRAMGPEGVLLHIEGHMARFDEADAPISKKIIE